MKHQTQTQTQEKASAIPARAGWLQRACACGQHKSGSGACAECRKKEDRILQRSTARPGPLPGVPPEVYEVVRSAGQPLDAGTRASMESRFGHNFGSVRIHDGARAAESANSVQALAYTVGTHIVFGAGRYQPRGVEGQSLLAHELTHVVQQSGLAQPSSGLLEVDPSPEAERQAEANALRGPVTAPSENSKVAGREPMHPATEHVAIQRQPRVMAYIQPRPCELYGLPCPPPPPRSPVPSCSALSHAAVIMEVVRHYVQDELDPATTGNAIDIDCFAGIGDCKIEFDSGVWVWASISGFVNPWAPPGVGGASVVVEEIPPPGASLSHPFFGRRKRGKRCVYDVDCVQPNQVSVVHAGCRARPGEPIGPGDFPILPEIEHMA